MSTQCSDISDLLKSWYSTENGQYLLRGLQCSLNGILDTTFGYHLLQLSPWGGPELGSACPIHHRLICSPGQREGVNLVAEWEELPLESDSVDAVIALHSLEFAAKPHQALREMQRVLIPHGHLIVIGFNPYSLLGLAHRLRGLSSQSIWHGHKPLSENRLVDWMHLLGCEVESRHRMLALPAFGKGRLRRTLQRGDGWCARHNVFVGGVYVLHAMKQVGGLHRPQVSRRRARLIDLAVPKPAAVPSPTPATPSRRDPGDDAA